MEIVIRAAIAFFILWLITRAAGRATLGELSSFDLLLFVTMGDLIQQGITMNDTSLVGGVLAVGTIAVLSVAMGYAGARWPKFGRLVDGKPIIVVHNGKIDQRALRREQVSTDELAAMARQSQFESFDDIRLATLEADGRISFFPKEK